jgi:sec-independent protein translocase protein TatA
MTTLLSLPFLFLQRLGPLEIGLIVLVFILLFGAKKIPEMMRGAGRGVREFKDALNKDYPAEEKEKESKSTDADDKKQ